MFQALHRHPPQKGSWRGVRGTWPSFSEQVAETVQNGNPPPPSLLKESHNPTPLGHHWGVWAEVLEGVCSCCHLRLPTQALVSEGGITVFPCSHAFHTVCLSQHGYQCVRCIQSQPNTAAHNAPSMATISWRYMCKRMGYFAFAVFSYIDYQRRSSFILSILLLCKLMSWIISLQ